MSLMEAVHAADRGERAPLLMGIVNITPDSFSDGGRYLAPQAAIDHAQHLSAQGADVLDLGAESTRPGYEPVPAEEEWQRLAPAVVALKGAGVPLSIDTTKAFVAQKALAAGAELINDVWGFQADPDMAATVAAGGASAVVMHNRHEIDPQLDLWEDWRRFFDRSLSLADKAGVSSDKLVLDPGVGFGKTPEQNLWAVRSLGRLRQHYKLPVLLGLSRKSFFGHFLGRPTDERLPATLMANLYGQEQGAALWRVHDVQAHYDVLHIQRLLAGTVP
ncbi:dihydropteroate synthase [Saccharibacter floricola]|uniref:Dihydropteroate synthase n=1 Tax=Saccharibacter floricola DSM 15669 TaxID=1123227 RepID=A0ABQ0NZ37_9PROT|nr:dihydropteroate synthase [Saccharibacter floricola]GBQ07079.1 dihydropteroate synthase [Saccharibacter floricola DSM 15669]